MFFKEVKQLLKTESFLGTSPNAVLIRIWTAMITILILKYLRATAKHAWCMSNMVAFLRINPFTKHGLRDLLDNPFKPPPETPGTDTAQMSLFDRGD